MRYYFAARYSRYPEMRQRRAELIAAIPDAEVTSRWIDCLDGKLEASYTPEVLAVQPDECWKQGQADLEDLARAEAIVSFTGDGGGGKGGRHVEHGIAIANVDNHPMLVAPDAIGEVFRLIVIGPRENIFHCHPATEVYATFAEFLAAERSREEAQSA